jgi:hypothetical protein
MQDRDYVRELARAVADGKSVTTLGKALLNEINRERSNLGHQAMLIQNLMDRYPDKLEAHGQAKSSGTATLGTPPATPDVVTPTVSDGNGLTPGQKATLMEIAETLVRERGVKVAIDPKEVIDLLAAQGEHLAVQQPRSLVGMYLYRAREREKTKANGSNGSLFKPAEAGKS